MNNSPLALKDLFAQLSSIPLDTLKGLFGEPLKQLTALQGKLESEDPQEREEALKKATELKDTVRKQIKKLYEDAGADFSRMIASLQKGTGK